MEDTAYRAIAIVGAGAILPDAPNVAAFWNNVKNGRYSISEVQPERWDPALYYDPDPAAPDKTYSKIGGWVREYEWEPAKWHLAIPPRVVQAMDDAQKWALAATRQALEDYGYPARALDPSRTAVILGNAMAGEKHYLTALRAHFPEYERELAESASFAGLPEGVRRDITRELHQRIGRRLPEITEDSMPGELANCLAGRIANVFNFRGPNYVVDAACASAMAAITAAVQGLVEHDFDAAITGGVDRNMGAPTFIKFCKIGALSATGSRPYASGADGFVMGEGTAILLLKRLADAERDGDRVYAVLRGMGGSSDGKGKGITAPNPAGQKLAIQRAWHNAGLSPDTVGLVEGHGTSTSVGDAVELQTMAEVLGGFHLPAASVALGSVKSNIGHLKGAAGAAGILKAALALRDGVLPPSLNCQNPNPEADLAHSPLYVNTALRPWKPNGAGIRRAGVSAFGFGGTNFHAVLEEYVPGALAGARRTAAISVTPPPPAPDAMAQAPLRGALVIGAANESALAERLRTAQPGAPALPAEADLRAPERLAIDYADAADLADKREKALKALAAGQPAAWKALRAQGIFRGSGPAPKVAFLYTGQGSQYAGMLQELRARAPLVADTFTEADRVMTPLVGKPLSDCIFVDRGDAAAVARAEEDLRQTAITQPAVLAADLALTRLLASYGVRPDMVMGHSLGEYGALVAAGALPFADALEAVSARGREMVRVSMADNGRMAAVFAPLAEIERILKTVDGYVVIANLNSERQAVIGGGSQAVERASAAFEKAGYNVVPLPVSHAFHTAIVAPASEPLRRTLERLHLEPPRLPVVANVDGQFYPQGPEAVPRMLDILARQVASPVQFVAGLRTLYAAGARVFVEAGPKKALHGFAEDVLGGHDDVLALFTNHPKTGDVASFNQALCGLYAAGLGRGQAEAPAPARRAEKASGDHFEELGRLFAGVLERGWELYHGAPAPREAAESVAVTGAALGLPGTDHVFDDGNVARILRGEQLIDVIPTRFRQAMLDKHITRLVKSDESGPAFESITRAADVIKLAGRGRAFDPEREFGIPAERLSAYDRVTSLAMGAGLDALRDAGIPLVLRHKTTSKGTRLPDRWGLPDELRDDTGVIFASAFPGLDSFVDEISRYYADRARREQLAALESLLGRDGDSLLAREIGRRAGELRAAIEKEPYQFDRRFMFRILSMGHSQFAEFIGARGPNTQINAACASTTQAFSVAEDWIRAGRCRRVVILSADDVTSDHLLEWLGAGFLATGAAATDEVVEEAALPFDRRRHGMILGMGAAAMVVESADAARERGLQPICEVWSTVTANSAFHGTRLDVQHITQVMEDCIARAEASHGVPRGELAGRMVFVSHETYTPARGGSASAEIHALRKVFGEAADRIVIANTKGITGHAMGTGIEDVVAVKAIETGCVPPVVNFKEIDPELGALNLSRGGLHEVEYALRLGAGFGSQISFTLLRRVPAPGGARRAPDALGYAYRIADPAAWNNWLGQLAGQPAAELEVVQRTLRIRQGPPSGDGRATRRSEETDPVKDRVLALVAEKTGYPIDMLALDLDLEADLGVDTVKQAEVFAAVREAYGIPRDDKLRLRDFPTLNHVIRFVRERRTAGGPVHAATGRESGTAKASAADPVKDRVLALVAEKTGYPIDMLALDLDLEGDLGVDTVKQAEVFAAVREAYSIPRDDKLRLRDFPTLNHVIRFVRERLPGAGPAPGVPGDAVKDRVLALVAEKTGYPTDMLDLDLDLEADLGVDTVKQAEVFAAVREAYGISREDKLRLRDFPTLNHVIRFVRERLPAGGPRRDSAGREPVAGSAGIPSEGDSTRDQILAIVAEKTGYPIDMLDLDLDLEADLGIDTVKQAEVFASVRAAFQIPREETLKLRDFPTLAHVIRFARERRSAAGTPLPAAPSATPPAPAPAVAASLEAAERIPRRVPVPNLRPPLALCKSTGIALGAGDRVAIMPDQGGVAEALAAQLGAIGVEVLRLDPAWEAPGLTSCLQSAGSIKGVFWLPALDPETALGRMEPEAWRAALRVRVKSLFHAMRAVYTGAAFLVAGTRLGGQHGYDDAGAAAPLGGAVTGFAKTFKRERPEALVKAVDFETGRAPAEIAETLLEEALRDPGAVEIGYRRGLRWTVGLQEQAAADGRPGMPLTSNTVFVVTGAAGSIVSAITADLAAASGGTFYLLDIVPEPHADDADLHRFATDREGLRRDLFARVKARGGSPAQVEKELQGLERAQAALSALEAVRAAGGAATWLSADLRDGAAVARAVARIRERSGRIDVLLHAAGMERSHFLPDKDPREFDLVFDVKADGWFHLLHAIGDMPLGAAVVFSSVAGRFGNAGQADYSAANDLLCKIVSSFRTTRPATRAIAIDWTAWAGIGMATRGSIPKMMEAAGIQILPPEAGIPWIRRELTAGGRSGEVVAAGALGILGKEWDETGGLNPEVAPAIEQRLVSGPMTGHVASARLDRGLAIETLLDPTLQPFLHDHQIGGTPLLPGVMGVEAFVEAAGWLLPGWHLAAVEEVRFLEPFKFYRGEPRAVTVETVLRPDGDAVVADCRLLGRRRLPGQADTRETTHFSGRVRLCREPLAGETGAPPPGPAGAAVEAGDLYRVYFHGPAYQVLERAWWDGERMIGRMAATLGTHHHPSEQPLAAAPRVLELCFQTAGLWDILAHGRMGLPYQADSIRVWCGPQDAEGPLHALVTPREGRFDAEVIDATGRRVAQIAGYATMLHPDPIDTGPLQALSVQPAHA